MKNLYSILLSVPFFLVFGCREKTINKNNLTECETKVIAKDFSNNLFYDVVNLKDGHLALLGKSPLGVYLFTLDTMELKQIGFEGTGPGQLQGAPLFMKEYSDNIWILDPRRSEAIVFSEKGFSQTYQFKSKIADFQDFGEVFVTLNYCSSDKEFSRLASSPGPGVLYTISRNEEKMSFEYQGEFGKHVDLGSAQLNLIVNTFIKIVKRDESSFYKIHRFGCVPVEVIDMNGQALSSFSNLNPFYEKNKHEKDFSNFPLEELLLIKDAKEGRNGNLLILYGNTGDEALDFKTIAEFDKNGTLVDRHHFKKSISCFTRIKGTGSVYGITDENELIQVLLGSDEKN